MLIRRVSRLVCGALMLSACAVASAQERRQAGPPPYDRAKETTVTAVVRGVESSQPPQGPAQAILMVTYKDAPLAVFLGPDAWFKSQSVSFKEGAAVEVTGLQGARYNGNPAMMPRTIKVGTRVLELRDAEGNPKWGGAPAY